MMSCTHPQCVHMLSLHVVWERGCAWVCKVVLEMQVGGCCVLVCVHVWASYLVIACPLPFIGHQAWEGFGQVRQKPSHAQ